MRPTGIGTAQTIDRTPLRGYSSMPPRTLKGFRRLYVNREASVIAN